MNLNHTRDERRITLANVFKGIGKDQMSVFGTVSRASMSGMCVRKKRQLRGTKVSCNSITRSGTLTNNIVERSDFDPKPV